jgi:hypothetical protein
MTDAPLVAAEALEVQVPMVEMMAEELTEE